ncbi:MAG: hypothetical protein PHI64_20580 [Zoogloea sp.]|uniref:hypothetical protein n=1 Tax=Zoogloea sp. TaxID=49181 RepID=UPI00261992FC|nr:hypothetical protein [Zoogloea sp.]MDD2991341.1 hypothetical protein [Zoogloea sp.]
MSASATRPEIGRSVLVAGRHTKVHDLGTGVLPRLLHVSGPGVTAWANGCLAGEFLAEADDDEPQPLS